MYVSQLANKSVSVEIGHEIGVPSYGNINMTWEGNKAMDDSKHRIVTLWHS